MTERIAIFWPGDYRPKPNELALPNVEQATVQLERALQRSSGARRYRVDGLPDQAARGDREARADRRSDDRRLRALVLRPAHDRRRRRQGQPAAPRQQLLGHLARAGRAAQHRRLPREPRTGRSRASGPTRRRLDAPTTRSWSGSTSGARPGASRYAEDERRYARAGRRRPRPRARAQGRRRHPQAPRARCSMLGDTSMGMINGYFGPRLLHPHRLHRAQGRSGLDHRSRPSHRRSSASTTRFAFVQDKGVTFHWGETDAEDFDRGRHARAAPRLPRRARPGRRVQGRLPRLAVPARPAPAAPAVGLRRGPVQLGVPARSRTATPIVCATEADQGNAGADGDDEAPARRRRACTRP